MVVACIGGGAEPKEGREEDEWKEGFGARGGGGARVVDVEVGRDAGMAGGRDGSVSAEGGG